jgi:hypothetical protein
MTGPEKLFDIATPVFEVGLRIITDLIKGGTEWTLTPVVIVPNVLSLVVLPSKPRSGT